MKPPFLENRVSTEGALKCLASGLSILCDQYYVARKQQVLYTFDLRNQGKSEAICWHPQSTELMKAMFVALSKRPDKETRKPKTLSVERETWTEIKEADTVVHLE